MNIQNSFNFAGFFQTNFQERSQPSFGTCLSKQAYVLPSLTLDYYNPLPNNYVNMAMLLYAQKYTLYNQLRNVISILSQIKAIIKQYGIYNAIFGNNNSVARNGNAVIGSNDIITGSSNWILTSNYTSEDAQDGVLALGNYLI